MLLKYENLMLLFVIHDNKTKMLWIWVLQLLLRTSDFLIVSIFSHKYNMYNVLGVLSNDFISFCRMNAWEHEPVLLIESRNFPEVLRIEMRIITTLNEAF